VAVRSEDFEENKDMPASSCYDFSRMEKEGS
jgi:hypothetical protein